VRGELEQSTKPRKMIEIEPDLFAQIGLVYVKSDRGPLVSPVLVRKVAGRYARRNKLHMHLVCWQEHRGPTRRPSSLRL
jgi:hypothetical protein